MSRLLFVDDNIVNHDPGEFPPAHQPRSATTAEDDWVDSEFEQGAPLGPMGYFIRDLVDAGFDVITATGVEDALNTLKKESGTIDVIVLDVMMPYLDSGVFDEHATAGGLRTGFVLAEEIHRMHPDIPIWILSQIVPGDQSFVNKATVDDLVTRGVIVDVVCKLDCCNANEFANRVRKSLEAV